MTQQQKIAEQIKTIGLVFEGVCKNAKQAAEIASDTGVVGKLAVEIDATQDGLNTLAGELETLTRLVDQ